MEKLTKSTRLSSVAIIAICLMFGCLVALYIIHFEEGVLAKSYRNDAGPIYISHLESPYYDVGHRIVSALKWALTFIYPVFFEFFRYKSQSLLGSMTILYFCLVISLIVGVGIVYYRKLGDDACFVPWKTENIVKMSFWLVLALLFTWFALLTPRLIPLFVFQFFVFLVIMKNRKSASFWTPVRKLWVFVFSICFFLYLSAPTPKPQIMGSIVFGNDWNSEMLPSYAVALFYAPYLALLLVVLFCGLKRRFSKTVPLPRYYNDPDRYARAKRTALSLLVLATFLGFVFMQQRMTGALGIPQFDDDPTKNTALALATFLFIVTTLFLLLMVSVFPIIEGIRYRIDRKK